MACRPLGQGTLRIVEMKASVSRAGRPRPWPGPRPGTLAWPLQSRGPAVRNCRIDDLAFDFDGSAWSRGLCRAALPRECRRNSLREPVRLAELKTPLKILSPEYLARHRFGSSRGSRRCRRSMVVVNLPRSRPWFGEGRSPGSPARARARSCGPHGSVPGLVGTTRCATCRSGREGQQDRGYNPEAVGT